MTKKTKKILAKIKEIKELSRGFVVLFEGVDGVDSLWVREGGNQMHYYGHKNEWVKIELEPGATTTHSNGAFSYRSFEVQGNIPLETFEWRNELRFKLEEKYEGIWKDENGIELKLAKTKKIAEEWNGPVINSILIRCTSSNQETAEEQIQELNQYLKEGKEYVLKNFSGYENYNRYNKRLELNSVIEGNLDLTEAGTTRVRKKSKWEVQKELRDAASNKIYDAIQRAKKTWSGIVGINGKVEKEGELAKFNEAVAVASELWKIAKYGSEVEKEVFNDHYNYNEYTAWNDTGESFKRFKEAINFLSLMRGWKYDLENPSSLTNQPTKTNDNSETNEEIPGPSGSPGTNDSNNSGNNKKRKNDGSDNDSRESKRAKVEEEVKQSQAKKDEEVSAKVANALQGLSENNTDEEKENKLAEIEKSKNEGKISEEQKAKITEKKDELASKDPQGYGKMMAEVLERKINEFKLQIDKLGQIIQDKLNKLKKGEYTSDVEVRQAEEEISEVVSGEVAVVETDNLLDQAQKVLNATAGNLKSQLEKIKKDLWSLKLSTNPYQQKAYQIKKDKVERAIKDLENFSQNKTQNPGFFRPEVIIPVSLAVVAVIGVATILIVKKRKQIKLKK